MRKLGVAARRVPRRPPGRQPALQLVARHLRRRQRWRQRAREPAVARAAARAHRVAGDVHAKRERADACAVVHEREFDGPLCRREDGQRVVVRDGFHARPGRRVRVIDAGLTHEVPVNVHVTEHGATERAGEIVLEPALHAHRAGHCGTERSAAVGPRERGHVDGGREHRRPDERSIVEEGERESVRRRHRDLSALQSEVWPSF